MAIQKQSLAGAEHDWFATRSGMTSNAPLNEHKAAYFASKGYGSNPSVQKPISQQESEWLASQTGVTSANPQDQWLEAVAGAGLTPSVSMNENKFKFFCNVTGTP